jgi:hypothetical protein
VSERATCFDLGKVILKLTTNIKAHTEEENTSIVVSFRMSPNLRAQLKAVSNTYWDQTS